MIKIISILLLINSIFTLNAQKSSDAEKLIKDYLHSVQTGAVQTSFNLKVIPKNSVNSQSISGSMIMKGNQFSLTTEDVKVWFDGKTQWALFEQNQEVNITQPSPEELAETNPMAILSSAVATSKVSFGKAQNTLSRTVVLTPLKAGFPYSKVLVQLSKPANQLLSIQVFNKDGSRHELTIIEYRSKAGVNSSTFRFDKAKYPTVIVNDLR